jgi:hypothetical protein
MSRRTESWRPRDTVPSSFDSSGHSASTLERLRTGWRNLCEDERDSVIAATLVASDLARLGAPTSIMGEAARVIEDEVRHVEVCRRVLDLIGAEPAEVAPTERRRASGDSPSLETKCANALFAGFAVGEAMSAACFSACRSVAKDTLIRWALTELLRDEARHGAFGVRAGSWVINDWNAARRAELWPVCVAEMQSFERALGGPIPDGALEQPINPHLATLGMLPPYATCGAAVACLPRWVLRPLASLGIAPAPRS